MGDQKLEELKIRCGQLFAASKKNLSWQWDSRFGMALAQFSINEAENVRKIIQEYLRFAWIPSELDQIPETVQSMIVSFGGLMPGQILFTSDPEEIFLLCAWWPWNNGKMISVRIAYHGANLTDDEGEALANHVQSLIEC